MGNIDKNKKKKKLPFGRNIFTLIFVFACVAVLFLAVYIIQSYVTAASQSKYTPFVTQSISDGKTTDFEEGSFNNIDERMKHDKFNDMGVYLVCTKYVEDDAEATTRQAIYKVAVYKNDNTPSLKNGKVSVSICMAAPWVGFIKYPSSSSAKELTICANEETAMSSSNSNYKSFTISGQIDFPAKANTWPVKVTVDTPTIYLYLTYTDTYSKTKTVVLEYSYHDLIPQDGGIIK